MIHLIQPIETERAIRIWDLIYSILTHKVFYFTFPHLARRYQTPHSLVSTPFDVALGFLPGHDSKARTGLIAAHTLAHTRLLVLHLEHMRAPSNPEIR